jgi:cell division septum initiation protein DivIVA
MAKLPVGYKSAFKKKASPAKFWQQALIAAAPGIISGLGSLFGRKKRRKEQGVARQEMQGAKDAYMNMQFTNPFEGMENPYQENLYEDLTVDRQGADYLREQQQQSQANIMQGMKGVAGSSGIAGLAQQMANVGAQQARQASVQISQQERQNEMYRIKGEQQRQKGSFGFDKMMREAQYKTVDLREQQRTENLYSLGLDRLSAADSARSTARSGMIKGLGQAAAGVAGTFAPGGANYRAFGSGSSAPTGTGFNFDIPEFGANAFGGEGNQLGLGIEEEGSLYDKFNPDFRFKKPWE